jgi:hypothetical protein
MVQEVKKSLEQADRKDRLELSTGAKVAQVKFLLRSSALPLRPFSGLNQAHPH